MNKILVDTSVIISHLRTPNKKESVLSRIFETYDLLYISAITEFEILRGAKPEQEINTKETLSLFEILNFESASANIASEIYKDLRKNGKPIDFPDLIIAATALHHSLQIVTHNTKHYENIPNLNLVEM